MRARRATRARDSTLTSLPNGVADPTYSCGKAAFWGATGPRAVLYIGRLCDDSERHLRVPSERDYLTRVKEAVSEKSRYLSSFADLRHASRPLPLLAPAGSGTLPRRGWPLSSHPPSPAHEVCSRDPQIAAQ